MESITIRMDKRLAKEMDKAMKTHYSTRTEFIREAIRERIKDIDKERALKKLEKYFGTGAHHKTTDADDRRAREIVSKEMAREYGFKLE